MTEEQQPDELKSLEEQMDEDQDELTRLQAELDEALREREQYKSMAQRSQADLVNYRRRSAEEMAGARERANSQLLLRMLSVADDLNRALDHIPADAVAPGWPRHWPRLSLSRRAAHQAAKGRWCIWPP